VNSVFKIENLECAYSNGKPVLHIQDLEIPKGKLVFVLGVSGIGKSTLIETLGLMNNTIKNSAQCKIHFSNKDIDENIGEIWDKDNDFISQFRRKHFSFIFQNTNLMPNFTAGENMAVRMLLEGKKISDSKERVMHFMDKLNLDRSLFDRNIYELSGGQRQRLAFVRAIASDFGVLFGDEPTGNLDKNTAHRLMSTLKEILEELQGSGLIVSHDIPLALNFADIILLLSRRDAVTDPVGRVEKEHYLIRQENDSWQNILGDNINVPHEFINQVLLK
jgi:ABC-type lipoprotein export system ATPase subunit